MEQKIEQLKAYYQEIYDLQACLQLLEWDQMTYMPAKGAQARGRQKALISRLVHQKKKAPELGQLLEDVASKIDVLPEDDDRRVLYREIKRAYDRAIRVPDSFIATFSAHCARKVQAWEEAREQDRFDLVIPYLEQSLEMTKQYASYFSEYDHVADAFIDQADQGMTVAAIRPLFTQLKEELLPILAAIQDQSRPDDAFLFLHYPKDRQLQFVQHVIKELGLDPSRARQDLSSHPFMIAFAHDDVRITTRVNERDLQDALFSSIHETGHALYELGISSKWEGTPLHRGVSTFVHESQSRLWENQVGRSRSFWHYFYPQLQQAFPSQLGNVSLEQFYQAINRVTPSLIRTDADEVTYNLHIMIRFDLELALLEGELEIRDLPEAWNEAYRSLLGVSSPTDREGVLQDIHWYTSWVAGMFHSYTLGNILSSQIFQTIKQHHPRIEEEIEQGNFARLHQWLNEHLYQFGGQFPSMELIQRVTDSPLTIQPYLQYLKQKFLSK